jgi:hypothetical protein
MRKWFATIPMTRSETIANLQALYGPPSQAGFGSAVFCDRVERAEDLEAAALKHYRYFLGTAWEQFGEEAWRGPWQRVYQRQAADRRDIVTELRSITDPAAQSSVTMLLDAIADPEAGRQALSAVYDDADVETLAVYTLGDGAALSGLLIAGRDRHGETTLLVFLLD